MNADWLVGSAALGLLIVGTVGWLRRYVNRERRHSYVQGRLQGQLSAARDPEVARTAVELDDMLREFEGSMKIKAAATPSEESDAASLLVRLMCSNAALCLAMRGASTLPAYTEMFPDASATKTAPKEAVAHFAHGMNRFVAELAKEAGRRNAPFSSTETVRFVMDEFRRAGSLLMNAKDSADGNKECDVICVAPGCTALDTIVLSSTQEEDVRLRKAVYICPQHRDAQKRDTLGIMYVEGEGGQLTDIVEKGLDWFRKATEEEKMAAQTVLGLARKVAQQGNAEWRNTLAGMYAAGQAPPDEADAKWLREVADEGNAEAQTALARMYIAGRGVPRDDAEALKWLRKAVDQGHAPAQALLGSMYYGGYGVVPQDYAQALELCRKAADQGNADAQTTLGFIYANGYGVPQDYAEALNWTLKAAEQGNADAQCHLGYLYGTGHGAAQENTEALKWFRKAANQGHAEAQAALKTMSATSAQNDADALNWYRVQKAADKGDADAKTTLETMSAAGKVPKSRAQMIDWHRRAADQGHASGQTTLGIMYQEGLGVPKDYVLAHMWLNLAANQNLEEAAKLRDKLLALMTPAEIGEAQRLAREWRPK